MSRILWMIAFIVCSGQVKASDVHIVFPAGKEFEILAELIAKATSKDYSIAKSTLSRQATYADFEALVQKDCKVIVTMDNFVLGLLKKYYEKHPNSKIRGVAAMGLNFKDVLLGNKSIAAVAYEIAGYLTIKGFRSSVNHKADNIVGFYRSNVSRIYAEEARDQLAREKISLQLVDIAQTADDNLSAFLEASIKSLKPDAIWLVNDNKLINTSLLSTLWFGVARSDGIPILCGLKKLSTELGICMYSEGPTPEGIAQKVTDIIYGYLGDDNSPEFYGIEYTQETERILNAELMKKFGVKSTGSDAVEYTGAIKE